MRLFKMAFGTLASLAGLLSACASQSKEPLRLTVNLPQAYVGEAYNAAITADGGIRPYKYSFDGNLPKGLTYADGRISGTPQEKGTFDLNITVEDGNLSSKAQKVTLNVGETPPPQLEQVFPLAEAADPFVYLLRVRNREAKGFQMQVSFKDMKPNLDSLKTGEGLLAVTRYNPETRLMDVDAVFVTPKKDLEMLRVTVTPDKKLRPTFGNSNPLLAFYDKNGGLVVNNPQIDRAPSEGKYKYADLQAIANNWGRKASAPPQGSAPAANAKAPTTPQAAQPQTPTQPQGAAQTQAPANQQPAQGQSAAQPQPQGAQAAQPQQDNAPVQPAQGQQNQNAQGQKPAAQAPAQPQNGQAQTPAPAQGQPQQTSPQTQKLEGDLNGDGLVDQKDLDLLRSSYAWASVAGVKQQAPANPQNSQNPNNQQPGQNQQQNPPQGPAPYTGNPDNKPPLPPENPPGG
ncbi:MAG: Ig family protein [Meiothermus sp.]